MSGYLARLVARAQPAAPATPRAATAPVAASTEADPFEATAPAAPAAAPIVPPMSSRTTTPTPTAGPVPPATVLSDKADRSPFSHTTKPVEKSLRPPLAREEPVTAEAPNTFHVAPVESVHGDEPPAARSLRPAARSEEQPHSESDASPAKGAASVPLSPPASASSLASLADDSEITNIEQTLLRRADEFMGRLGARVPAPVSLEPQISPETEPPVSRTTPAPLAPTRLSPPPAEPEQNPPPPPAPSVTIGRLNIEVTAPAPAAASRAAGGPRPAVRRTSAPRHSPGVRSSGRFGLGQL
jgi:hypothetical protein